MSKDTNNVGADASVRPISKDRQNKGITLIALVITIIVMLILVAVTISMAINGGLFGYAGKATGETQHAIEAEQTLAEGKVKIDGKIYNSIDDYLNGIEAELFSEIYGETKPYTDKNGDTAVIPKGFAVGTTDNINTVKNGLVIQDAEENQFVWIPVEVTATDTETRIASFYRSNWENNARNVDYTDNISYIEPYTGGYEGEEAEYYDMVKSVYINHGFYIGRYKAGSIVPRTNKANETTTMVVKRDVYPYNYVGWGLTVSDYTSDVIDRSGLNQGKGALALSKTMYEGKDVGVTSTLCYGIQWDAMLDYIKDEKKVTGDKSWGNYPDSIWTINRQTAEYSKDSGETWEKISELEEKSFTNEGGESAIILTTGANNGFSAKNIYDVTGCLNEWTMEIFKWTMGFETDVRLLRMSGARRC